MMHKKLLFFGTLLFLAACSSSTGSSEDIDGEETSPIEQVDMDFDDSDKFDDPVKLKLLEELNLCGPTANDSLTVACSPKFFTFIKLKEDKPLNDAFILKIRSMTMLKSDPVPFPERRILVFEREKGQLVRTNGFVGELVQFEGSKNGVKSPMIVLYDPAEDILFHCAFEWSEGRYVYKSCEGLDIGGGPKPIKAAMKDSISKEIYTDMVAKSRIF